MQIPLKLDRSCGNLLVDQIVAELKGAIKDGRIAAGCRLPSSRRLAAQLDVARNTVVRAYERLVDDAWLEPRPSSGYFAARRLPEPVSPMRPEADPAPARPLPGRAAFYAAPDVAAPMPLGTDFRPGRANAGLFPLKTWRRHVQGSLAHGGALGLVHAADPAGLPALRAAIAGHLAATRGILADPARIIVTSGVQQGLVLAARLLLGPGQRAIIEAPGRAGAARAFAAEGAEVCERRVDRDGLVVADLDERPAALIHVTPAHQVPTGHALCEARRRDLLAWALRQGCLIVESDEDGDLRYRGSPEPALAGRAPDQVIHLGSFAETLGAGLGLGYLVAPAWLAAAFRGAKALLDPGGAWLDQAALAEMIAGGSYGAHLARLRQRYGDSREALIAALRRCFGPPALEGDAAGLHLMWHLPPGLPDAPVIEVLARRAGIGVYGFASAGCLQGPSLEWSRRRLLLGFAGLSPKQIDLGVARLSDAIDDAVDEQLVPVDDLFGAPGHAAGRGTAADLVPCSRQQPALRILAPRRSDLGSQDHEGGSSAMVTVTGLYRYPIKGLSAQPLAKVLVAPGQPLPMDRVFALVRPGAPIDHQRPHWAKKGLFVMLMLDEGLARVKTSLDVETLRLSILDGNAERLSADLGDPEQRAAVEDFFLSLVPNLKAPPRLVKAAEGHFMDKPDNVISLINLATLRSLEEQWGYGIDPLRFRANVYVDGLEPWAEFDWIDQQIRIGDATFRVDRRNGRCSATNVNPLDGRRDLDIPGALRASFGHKNLGVYLLATSAGRVAVGDPISGFSLRRGTGAPAPAPISTQEEGRRRFICRGCYFIYAEAEGVPQDHIAPGTPFGAIDAAWRCPDCGTGKSIFRPYLPERSFG